MVEPEEGMKSETKRGQKREGNDERGFERMEAARKKAVEEECWGFREDFGAESV